MVSQMMWDIVVSSLLVDWDYNEKQDIYDKLYDHSYNYRSLNEKKTFYVKGIALIYKS